MAAAGTLLSEKQFLCPICLDVFTDPVTTPCGHNFCKSCITHAWELTVKSRCPLCKELFSRRPELRVNTFISQMVDQFRNSAPKKAVSVEQKPARAGNVPCDICKDTEAKALKSCMVCLTSYCEAHLVLHQKIPAMATHELVDPVEDLGGRTCKQHARPLELFCRTDQMYVCRLCMGTDHRRHHFSPLEKEYQERKAALGRNEAELQQMIQERRLKILEFKHSLELSKEGADREAADGVRVFTALIQSAERGLAQLLDTVEEKQKTVEAQIEGFIRELEEEISELTRSSAEVEQLSRTEDHLQFLQSLPSLSPAPATKDWTEVRGQSWHGGAVRGAVAQLEKTLSVEIKRLCADTELRRAQQHEVDVTLDPDTAHPALILSENKRRVSCGDVKKSLPDNPARFSLSPCVLGEQGFSSGRFYYEVQVTGKTKWDLGVVTESVNRKGHIAANPAVGFWVIWLKNGNEYRALDEPGVSLSLKSKPQRVGVFVDYEEGLVSFYDVDAAALIYSFTGCNFTEKLFPFFGPCTNDGGKNSAPLIISPVNHTA